MALLRMGRRIAGSFGESLMNRRIIYSRSFVHVARIEGYVTSVLRPNHPTLRLVSHKISIDNYENIENENPRRITVQSQLSKLCSNSEDGKVEKEKLLRLMTHRDEPGKTVCPETFGLTVLHACGHLSPSLPLAHRRNFIDQVWSLIEENLSVPTSNHVKVLLAVYARHSLSIDPDKFLAETKVPVDFEIYKLMLNCVAKTGDVESTERILSLMKSAGCYQSELAYSSLIQAFAAKRDIESVLSNLAAMKDDDIVPNAQILSYVACGYAAIGDINAVKNILKSLEVNVEQLMRVVRSLSFSDNGEHVPSVLEYLPKGVDFSNPMIADEITELTFAGKAEDAFRIVDKVVTNEATERRDSFLQHFLRNLIKAKIPVEVASGIADRLEEEKMYSSAIVDVTKGALDCKEWMLATKLFAQMRNNGIPVRPHYYWPILLDASRNEGESKVLDTIRDMLRLGVPVDHETLSDYVLPFVNTTDVGVTVRKLADTGLTTRVVVTPLMCHLLMHGRLTEAAKLCAKYSLLIDFSRILQPLQIAYSSEEDIDRCVFILKEAPSNKYYPEEFLVMLFGETPKEKDLPTVKKFLEAFKARDVHLASLSDSDGEETPDVTKWSGAIINPLDRSINKAIHPRDMSLDELECHLIELKAKRMNTRGVLRKLLLEYCRQNNVAKINEIKKQYDENGFLWTSGMYAMMFNFYAKNGRVAEARDAYASLRCYHPDFKIDDEKILHFATALVEDKNIEDNNRRIEEVIEVIESQRSKGGAVRECWRLLNAIAHSEFSEITETILDILVCQGYCGKNNTLLGPLIRRHLINNDLESAFDTFKKLAEQYKCTPLRQVLINELLKSIKEGGPMKNRSIQLLDEVASITRELYGSDGLNVDLVQGLAGNSMRQELRQFFETNHVRVGLLKNNLTYVSNEKKLKILTELFDSCLNLSAAQTDLVIEESISAFSRSGNWQGAIELWEKMRDRNIKESPTFVVNFVDLLKKHNVPLPKNFRCAEAL